MFLLVILALCQSDPPFESPIPPRWEREALPDHATADRLAAFFPSEEILGTACSLASVPAEGWLQSNPALLQPNDPYCRHLRRGAGVDDLGQAECGVGFYVSDGGEVSQVVLYRLPDVEAAETAQSRVRDALREATVVRAGTVVVYVRRVGSSCELALSRAIAAAAGR